MGKIRVLVGRANTGKTSCMEECIRGHLSRGEHAIWIVPEQFTYETEKQLASRFGGLIGVEVYSFARLCERILENAGVTTPFLSKQGRCMVIRRAAFQRKDALMLFGRVAQQHGFAERMDALISQMKQCCIRPEDLRAAVDRADAGSLLSRKLGDIALLYEDSEAFLSSRYLTANDRQEAVLSLLPDSLLRGCHVYIDGLDNPSRQLFFLLRAICGVAASVTLALHGSVSAGEEDAALFAPDARTLDRLREIAAELGLPFSVVPFPDRKVSAPPALAYLEHNLFSFHTRPFEGQAEEVCVLAAPDRTAEAEQAADLVLKLAQSGVRYRDMTVVVSDMAGYGPRLKRAFHKRGIPLFYDAQRPVLGHPAVDLTLAAVRCAAEGFPVRDILRIVKSGFAPILPDDAEILENYLLRYGVFGSSMQTPFSFGEVPPEAEQARSVVMPPLLALREELKTPAARDKIAALYRYLTALGLRERLSDSAAELMNAGSDADAAVTHQVWDTLCDLMTQAAVILGDTPLTRKEFLQILEEGTAGYHIGVVPGMSDQVLLGDIARTRSRAVDTLIVLGCNEGLLPRTRGDDELLCDAELASMQQWGLPVWNDTGRMAEGDRLELYELLSRARRRLYLLFAFSDGGAEMLPSPVVDRVRTLLPACRVESAAALPGGFPTCERTGFALLMQLIRRRRQDGSEHPLTAPLIEYYRGRERYRGQLADVLSGRAFRTQPDAFPQALTRAMYGQNPSVSPTRLEQFNRCAFSHYIKYGLMARERPEAMERSRDAGTFVHDALDAVCRLVAERGLSWRTLTEADVDELLSVCIPPLIETHNDGILMNDVRLREGLFLKITVIKLSVMTIVRQVAAGRFTVADTELAFGGEGAFPPLSVPLASGETLRIYGKIDRVDRTEDGLFRVIDYKLGGRPFEPERVSAGVTLQLPLYLAAAAGLCGEGVGMYYMPLSVPVSTEDKQQTQALDGVTASDEDAILAAETGLADESELIRNLKRGKDGAFSGTLCTREQMKDLTALALSTCRETADRMQRGEAGISPLDNACKYCPYLSVCRFDAQLPGFHQRTLTRLSLEKLLQKDGDEI